MITDEDILRYAEAMRKSTTMQKWMLSRTKVTIDELRVQVKIYSLSNFNEVITLYSSPMTKLIYTYITKCSSDPVLYAKFSSGAKIGEAENSLLRGIDTAGGTMTAFEVPPAIPPPTTATAPAPPWDGYPYPNPCANISLGQSQSCHITDPIDSNLKLTIKPKGTTMNKVFEKKAFVHNQEISTQSDEMLLNVIRNCQAGIKDLESIDVVSKYTIKQIALYKKAIKNIIKELDKRADL